MAVFARTEAGGVLAGALVPAFVLGAVLSLAPAFADSGAFGTTGLFGFSGGVLGAAFSSCSWSLSGLLLSGGATILRWARGKPACF